MTDLTAGIRRAAAPERAKGPTVPSTAGSNGGDPVLQAPTPSSAVGGSAASFPKADGAHKTMGWHELSDVEVRAYTETLVALTLMNGEAVTIDPTRCQLWRLSVSGETTVVVPRAVFPAPATERRDAPERRRTWSCVVIVSVPSGGKMPTFSGPKWAEGSTQPNIKSADGTTPANLGGVYVFTFMYDPIYNEVLGFESGSRF